MKEEIKGVWRTVRGRRIFIKEGEDLKTAMVNSGKFKEMRKNHFDKNYEATKQDILDHYTEDYGWTDITPEEAFIKQMDAVNYGNATPYQMGKRLANGGNYLIYNGDMADYLNKRGIKATSDDAFDKYTDYIGKQSAKLYDEIKNKQKASSLGKYKYYTKHGMGPGTVPKDVEISNIKDYDDGMTSFETNRPLSSKELSFYSIENEIKNAVYDAKYGHNSTSDSKIKNYTKSLVQRQEENISIPTSLKEGFIAQKSSYNEESKMSFIQTEKGNLELVYDNKATGTIMKNTLSEETAIKLRDAGRLMSVDEYYQRKDKIKAEVERFKNRKGTNEYNIKEGNPLQKKANERIKEVQNTLNNDKAMIQAMKKQGINEVKGMTIKDFENRIKKNEEYLKIAKK